MKKKFKIVILSIVSIFISLFGFIAILAYYEYYGQYSTILNVDGTIKLDAFDVLYPELRELDSYGRTPDNPYVIDNATRLRNLIKLNNSGKLLKSKRKDNVDKYYFNLQFDAQEIPQILNLISEGEFSTIGNNEYPFVDELSGIVYGYEYTNGYIAYYSGCLPIYTKKDNAIYINGVISNIDATQSPYTSWSETDEYILSTFQYDSSITQVDGITYDDSSTPTFINISDTTIIHQVIANETIAVADNQIDVGFISNIGDNGYAHDIILYNETLIAKEENLFATWLSSLTELFSDHKRVKTDLYEERHIGLFAGHISENGNAKNISVSGESNINIDTERVNYYSNFTTVGYIDDNALIGGRLFSEIALDSMNDGEIAGCLFADVIYNKAIDESLSGSTDSDGATHYTLTEVGAESPWPGTDGTEFKYGSFTFLLSASTDTVSSIWANSSELYMLNQQGYKINGSALYCTDEYRYQADNGINQGGASVKEATYSGVTKLENTGNVIDKGKYAIVAHIDDKYYALKIYATEDASGNITYYFDTSDKINITQFINGHADTNPLYQSALWEVLTPSATPTFLNSRFTDEYFDGDTSSQFLNATNNLAVANATQFSINLSENTFYFDNAGTRYYLNFDESENSFYFSDSASTAIELFNITDGYTLTGVTSANNITNLGSYIIVARDTVNDTYKLLGVNYNSSEGVVLQEFDDDLDYIDISGFSNSGFTSPVVMSATEYKDYANYIWRISKNGNNISIVDRISNSLYLSSNGTLILSNQTSTWTYSQGTGYSCRLNMGNNYLSFNGNITDGNTRFTSTTTNPGYILYLFEITPQDETPPYITYDGAKYLDAVASTIETGTYSVVATAENGEQYVIGVNGSNVSVTNRFIQAPTTYNSLYTYYSRTGSGTANNPYVYGYADISEYTEVAISSQAELNTAITTYGAIYEYALVNTGTYNYNQEFTIENTDYYYVRGNGYQSRSSNFQRGVQYYTRTNTGSYWRPSYSYSEAFLIQNNVTYYSNTNGTVATTFNAGTYYTRTEITDYRFTTTNTYNQDTSYYYKSLDCNNAVTYYVDYVYSSNTESVKYYEWNVSDSSNSNYTTTASPIFKNIKSTTYYYTGTSISTTGSPVYYDAINQQLFYINNDTAYYVYVSNNGTLNSTSTIPSTNVSLYKVETKHVYNNFTEILTQDNSIWNHSDYYYFISTKDLSDKTSASYLIGSGDYSDITSSTAQYTEIGVDYHSMQNTYYYDSLIHMFTTTEDLSQFTWKAGTTTTNGGITYYSIYNVAFESYNNKANNYHLFLGVSSDTASRSVKLSYTRAPIVGGSYTPTGFTTTYANRNQTTGRGGYYIGFKGGGDPYYLNLGNSNPSVVGTRVSFSTSTTTGLYYYYCTSITDMPLLSLVSSKGDSLEQEIHYAIAAKSGDNYYAMTYDSAKPTNGITGTDMTTQFELIKSVGTYTSSTTVPSNCDWEQISNDNGLRFMHYNSSTTTNMNYLDQTQTNGIRALTSSQSYSNSTAYYYDIVNKLMYYEVTSNNNVTVYYVTYNSTTNTFGTSTSKANAAQIEIIRYTPSYKVERVTSIDSQMSGGEYVFAGYSVDGYTAIGITGGQLDKTYNITNYLTSELSEADYNEILEYIWLQRDSSSITDGATSINMLISNYVNYNGIAAYKTNNGNSSKDVFTAFSSSTNYTMSLNNGLWSMYFADASLANGTGYYLGFTQSTTTSTLKINSTLAAIKNYVSGVSSSLATSTSSDTALQVAIYQISNDEFTQVYSLSSGNSYAVFVKDGTYWYMLYLNGTALAKVQIGKNLNDIAIKVANTNVTNYSINTLTGPSDGTNTYGYYLYYLNGSTRYYLYSNNNTLSVTTTQNTVSSNETMHWDYSYNAVYPNKSNLYTVYQTTINNYLGVSGSKVTTDGSATYLYTVGNNNQLGSIATSVSNGNKYAIVIFNDGNYYIVSRESQNSVNVTYNSYGSGLPTTLSDLEVFTGTTVTSGYSFTQTVNGNTCYLIVDTNTTLTLSQERGSCYFAYSGSVGSGATFTGASESAQYVVYLFRISKNDALDRTTDVTVNLTSASQIAASLSVVKSDDYIIVANVGDKYYALSVTGYDDLVALDITETMTDALAGGNIRLYTASIFEQLGTEYSMIFNSEAFNGSFYYLLDGTYETTGSSNKPVITPISLYNSTETYYTVNATVYTGALNNVTILDDDYYYNVSGCYIKALTYDEHLVYFTLECVQFDGTDFDENKTYYQMESGYVEAYEYKNYVKYYIRNGNSYDLVNISEFATGVTYYINLGTDAFVAYNSKRTEGNNISDSYKWTIIPYSDTGQTGYVIGYYDDAQDNTRYIYYDSTNREFKLTTTISQAYASGALVQAYRLGNEITQSDAYKTFNIYLEDDNVTIISFPLNEVTSPNDITLYSQNESEVEKENGTTMSVIPGEYLFAYKDGDYYYALTLDSNNDLSYSDITLLFNGNFVKDENGYYCVTINTSYLWNQVVSNFTVNANIVSGLQFQNDGTSFKIENNSEFDITIIINSDGTVYLVCDNQYLYFDNGFGWTSNANLASKIIMYSVGADAPAVSENQVLTYTYYSSTLDSIDYSFFNFSKYLIENLPNYSNVFGTYEYTTGWYIDSQTLLKEANSSVYFADSISRTDFTSITYKYDYLNENTNQTTEKTLTYYAPTGSTSFVINDVTETDPVYVNVIVSTEMANSAYMSRYLALWKMDSINAEAGTAENLSTQSQYMNKFNQILKTPYAAIPLANHYDTSTGSKSTSLVKVGDDYLYLNNYGYDHLIAHTFIITEPGIYYLGSTDGTLAISYLSIDKMKDTAESEDSSKNISEDFTIDFVWGSVGSDSDFSQINSTSDDIEAAIGNIAYVGRVDSDDVKTWVHSNLYPEFVNGTPGVFEPDSNLDYYTIDLVKIEHLNSFAANTNYYIKNGNNYELVDTANTEFDYSLDYYILDSGNYVLVHEGMNDSITYYYIINKDNKLYLEPATTYARNATYYRLDITMVSISDFDANKAYYVLDGDEYELAYNPFDYLNLSAERTYNNGITTTTINYETYDNNYYYGYGIMYINANKNSNKASRIIVLSYTEKQ